MEYTKYLIAVPCLDQMPTPFVASLTGMKRVGACKHSFLSNSLVYDARNMLAMEAIETGADRVLFIDSDMCFSSDLMERLAEDMDDNGIDYVCGLFFKRALPTAPCIYKEIGMEEKDGRMKGKVEQYTDYPRDSMFPIAGSGFGAVMLTTKMLVDVANAFDAPFAPIIGILGEDLAFCWRAKSIGYEMYCDSRIKVGHVGSFVFSEAHYRK